MLGELGGIIEIFAILFGLILNPISKQMFVQVATRLLFKARTKDTFLFQKTKKKTENSRRSLANFVNLDASLKTKEELENHQEIKIKTKDSFKLCLSLHGICVPKCCWSNKNQL